MRGDNTFEDVRVQDKKPTETINRLAKLEQNFWHIDYERDIHYYRISGDENAPYALTDTSENFGALKIEVDTSNLKNRQVVRGGEAPDQTDYEQVEVCD